MKFKPIFLGAAAALLVAGVVDARGFGLAKGDFRGFGSLLEWKPKCIEPVRPYGKDPRALRVYMREVDDWSACVDRQAEADAAYAVEQVQDGRDKALRRMREQVLLGY